MKFAYAEMLQDESEGIDLHYVTWIPLRGGYRLIHKGSELMDLMSYMSALGWCDYQSGPGVIFLT